MSETQRNLFNRRTGGLLIAGAFILFLFVVVVGVLSPSPRSPEREPIPIEILPAERFQRPASAPPRQVSDWRAEAFYRTIIDNNLFRPLGWRPPVPREPYRLIGTILPRSETHTPPQAIIESTIGNTTYIVSIGEPLDAETEVVSIESKQVTLSTNGEQRTLSLNTAVYLNPLPARRHPRRTPHTPIPTPIRTPTPMRRPPAVSAPQTDRPPSASPRRPLSEWLSRERQPIRLGDALLKNPQKWGLRHR